MRCVIADDEPLARERLRELIVEADPESVVVGEAGSGREAVALSKDLRPDAIFLDIHMPDLDGFDVVDLLAEGVGPAIVFVTADDGRSLDAFAVAAVDYLTKPVRLERLRRTLVRLRRQVEARKSFSARGPAASEHVLRRLKVTRGDRQMVVSLSDVVRFEADRGTAIVHLKQAAQRPGDQVAVARTEMTLDWLEAHVPSGSFLRAHRSHLVNADVISEVVPWFAGSVKLGLSDGSQVPVSRRRVAAVMAQLGG
jgi:two-component system, LytTR family, response regulator